MQDTEQINYIADCLTNYKIKIQVLNKAGLFDSAKLFEYFALEILVKYEMEEAGVFLDEFRVH